MTGQRVSAEFDLALGGRWTSLTAGGREWLWRNPDDDVLRARQHVDASSAFVDAGGGEECHPCVREPFDHGLVWSRPWQGTPALASVGAHGYRLERAVGSDGPDLVVEYRATAETPRAMLHTTHLLLELSERAQLVPDGAPKVRFFDPAPTGEVEALGGVDGFVRSLGAGGPSAVCYGLPGCRRVRVLDGDAALELSIATDRPDLPVGFVVWRNLMGWPEARPYRSIGIEPAVGHVLSLPAEDPRDAAVVGPDDEVVWRLRVRAV